MPPQYKYESEIAKITNCPPHQTDNSEREVFRFVHSNNLPNSFLPPAVIKPSRVNKATSPKQCCSLFALSMFTSEQQARQRFAELEKNNRNIRKTLGDRLAAGTLQLSDGRQTKPNSDGHLDLHEHAGVVLHTRFSITGRPL